MKTAIRKSLVLVVLLATMVSYGNEISGNTNDGKSVKTSVTFKNVRKGSVLSIKDNNGLTLYKEFIKINGDYAKRFDLTALPDGDYYFELNKDVQIEVIPFKVDSTIVTFDKASKTRIFKPVVWLKNKKVYVSRMAFAEESIEVEILFESNERVLIEKIKKKGELLGKIYDFSTSEKGTYTIITKSNGRRFVNYVQII